MICHLHSAFPHNRLLCPVVTLKAYEQRTAPLRGADIPPKTTLFLTTIKPHGPASSSTIARWLKNLLARAGIDTSIFKAHSVRGASSTAAHNAGVTTCDIMNAADWSSQSVFQKFYYKPSKNTQFGTAVLSQSGQTNTTNTH